jgi:hypothetical protein
MLETITHCAFSDESRHNVGRYRSIGMVSFPFDELKVFNTDFLNICNSCGINNLSNFKWGKINNNNKRNAAKQVMEYMFNKAIIRKLRIDVLIWDTNDSRHKIMGRDDPENLARMYYHLYRNVFLKRWPNNSFWNVYPDSNSSIDWNKLNDILMTQGLVPVILDKPGEEGKAGWKTITLKNKVVLDIIESNPLDNPLIQVADLFAGMATYSMEEYNKIEEWLFKKSGQIRLFHKDIPLSNRDDHRCLLINDFKQLCKKNKFSVSLESSKGFRSYNPSDQINFWFYKPQTELDKAPIKNKE